MAWIDYGCFGFLAVAKSLYDNDLLEKVLEAWGDMEICEDVYSLAWEGIARVFQDFAQYYNEEKDTEILVFADPVITDFYQLCSLYEASRGVSKENNTFRLDGESEVYQCFVMDAYGYDVRLYDGHHGKSRMVILAGEEFYGYSELPGVLADVKWTLASRCEKLKCELVKEISAPQNTEMEAA